MYYLSTIVSSIPQYGCSPLYMASQKNHIKVVDILLKAGANPDGMVWMICSSLTSDVKCQLMG